MRNPVLLLGTGIAITAAAWLVFFAVAEAPVTEHATTPPHTCDADARVCPDGTVVGRTGPDCTFAACPTEEASSSTVTTYLGGTARALSVVVTPLALVQDSRCPADVQCIWAGTVVIRARIESGLGTSTREFELGKPVTTEAEEITLIAVAPVKRTSAEIPVSSYRFTFEIKRR